MKSLTIAGANLRRLLRDPTGIFFIFVFPLIIIVTLGAVFGGGFTPKLGLVASDGPLARAVVQSLRSSDEIEVEDVADRTALVTAVERGQLEGGLVIPPDYDEALARGDDATARFIARPNTFEGEAVRGVVASAIADQAALIKAARFAQERGSGSFQEGLRRAEALQTTVPNVEVDVAFAGIADEEAGGRFGQSAASQLILFMFLTSLSAASQLIQTRHLGVSRRMLSTPTAPRTILWGETLGRFGVALMQGLFIVAASALLFGVDWGDPLGTASIVTLFALVGTGAAMLFGSLFSNEQQAASVGTFAGLALAALGGCMVPLEVFPAVMQTVARVTPHAWAVEGLNDLVVKKQGFTAIVPDLLVLAGFAAALLSLATWRLYRAMVS